MSIDSQLIGAALLTDIDRTIIDKLSDIHLRVCRDMFCRVTDQILDSRTAQLVTLRFTDEAESEQLRNTEHLAVVAPSVTREQLERCLAAFETVGKELRLI